jgi:hypothetical protein
MDGRALRSEEVETRMSFDFGFIFSKDETYARDERL